MNNITTFTPELEQLRKQFIDIVNTHIHREGINDLLMWLDATDFYTAPASTKYHGSVPGGLVDHSITVFNELYFLMQGYGGIKDTDTEPKWVVNKTEDTKCYQGQYSTESIAIVSLFHDLCKINTYKTEFKNVKKDDKWVKEPYYVHNEEYKFGGHGSKSVYLAMRYIKLTEMEASAINSHMGAFDQSTYSQPAQVYAVNPLAWLLHVADESATYIREK